MEDKYSGYSKSLKKKVNKGRRNSKMTKYGRELVIIKIAEMTWGGKTKSDIVQHIHNEYGYAIKTINDLISEANRYAATVYTDEEKNIKLKQIANLYHDMIFSEDEHSMTKLKAADQLSKLMKYYSPDVAVQLNTFNLDGAEKLSDNLLNIIEDKLNETKNGE